MKKEGSVPAWTVYMVRTCDGKLYTGITTNLERRFKEHASNPRGARFFRMSQPEAVVYAECVENRSLATKREAVIKKMTRHRKLQLIEAQNRIMTLPSREDSVEGDK